MDNQMATRSDQKKLYWGFLGQLGGFCEDGSLRYNGFSFGILGLFHLMLDCAVAVVFSLNKQVKSSAYLVLAKETRSCDMSILISFDWGGSEAGLQEQRVAEVCLVKEFRDRFEGKERH